MIISEESPPPPYSPPSTPPCRLFKPKLTANLQGQVLLQQRGKKEQESEEKREKKPKTKLKNRIKKSMLNFINHIL